MTNHTNSLITELDGYKKAWQNQSDYSIDLQRIIEDLCNGCKIRKPKTKARFHYDMAVYARAALAQKKTP